MNWPFQKIRHRTIALVTFACLVPMVLMSFFVLTRTRAELSLKALEVQKTLTETIRRGLSSQIVNYGRQLTRFAEDMGMQSMNPVRQQASIYSFLDINPLFYSCFVYDTKGTLQCLGYRNRFDGDFRLIGRNILAAQSKVNRATAEAFAKVLKTGQIAVGQEVIRSHQQTQMLVLVPIRSFGDPRQIVGVMSCGVQVDGPSLQGSIEDFSVGEKSFILLTNNEGRVMARSGKDLPAGLERMILSQSLEGTKINSAWSTLAGKEYIVTAAKVPIVDFIIAIGTPTEEVFGFIWQILLGMILLTLICLMLGLFFSFLLSETLVSPILSLIAGIKNVSDGMLSYRIEVEGGDELSEAGRAFNEMASRMEKNRLLEEMWSRKWNPPE